MAVGLTSHCPAPAIALFCAVFLQAWQVQGENITLAISDFQNNTGIYAHDVLEKSVPEQLKTELSLLSGLLVLERSRIEAVLQEQALGQTGVIDSEQAKQVGQLLGAQFVLTGELSSVGGRFRIDVHIVRVESGEVFAEKVTGPDASALETMLRVLANNIRLNLTGNGRRITTVQVRHYQAPWIISAGLGSAVAAALFQSVYQKNEQDYKKARQLGEFDGPYDKANRAYHWRTAMIGSAAVLLTTGLTLWLTGRSDANKVFASHPSSHLRVGPYYSAASRAVGIQLCVSK